MPVVRGRAVEHYLVPAPAPRVRRRCRFGGSERTLAPPSAKDDGAPERGADRRRHAFAYRTGETGTAGTFFFGGADGCVESCPSAVMLGMNAYRPPSVRMKRVSPETVS